MTAAPKRYRVRLQYLGTRYRGWQIQDRGPTVQGVLSEALAALAGEPVSVVGAGRTDAGVHALAQVAHFRFPPRPSVPDLRRSLNALLPWDIRVLSVRPAPPGFHARRSARRKRYDYRWHIGPVLPPALYQRVTHLPARLDVGAMREAARLVVGRHDFSGFAAASTTVKNRVREVTLSHITRRGHNLAYRVEADGFLHHMVRNLAGTLTEIGRGRRPPRDVLRILEAGDRRLAGPTAPPHGLYLVRVWY